MSHVDEGTLHAYLDGELPSSERAALEAHLAQCTTCRATLAEERALLERASALLGSTRPIERPAPPFEQLRRPKRSQWRVRTPFAWAASIMLALGLGYYLRDPENNRAMFAPSEPAVVAQDRNASAPAPALGAERQQRPTVPTRFGERRRVSTPPADEVASMQSSADSLAAVETPPAAAGAISLKSSTQLRSANPATPAPALRRDSVLRLDEVVVTGESPVAALRGRGGTTQWQIISRGAAMTLLGTDPVGLPGLATRRIRRSPAPDATVVVEQVLDSSTVIQIFQRPMDSFGYYIDGARRDSAAALARQRERAPAAAAREIAPADRLARFVGRLRVEISGPLSTDSLNRLLEQVEPLP